MTDEPTEPKTAPTQQEASAMLEVASAGEQAVKNGQDPAPAMKSARDRTQLPISDDDIDRIASRLNGLMIDGLREQGAFDPLPEPVAPPAQPAAPEEHPGEEPVGAPAPAPARRKSFAERFMGL